MQYYGPKRFLDSLKKFHTGLTIFNNKKQDLGKPSLLASTVAVRFGFSRNSINFRGLYLRAQEELEARTTCVVKPWM